MSQGYTIDCKNHHDGVFVSRDQLVTWLLNQAKSSTNALNEEQTIRRIADILATMKPISMTEIEIDKWRNLL
jgi:hypothetical protein